MRARRNATTARSRTEAEFQVTIVNAAGFPVQAVGCHNSHQCREVVRVEAPLYGPYTLFFVTERGKPKERWAVSRSGVLQKLSYREA